MRGEEGLRIGLAGQQVGVELGGQPRLERGQQPAGLQDAVLQGNSLQSIFTPPAATTAAQFLRSRSKKLVNSVGDIV